jgi:hypothetical protein
VVLLLLLLQRVIVYFQNYAILNIGKILGRVKAKLRTGVTEANFRSRSPPGAYTIPSSGETLAH